MSEAESASNREANAATSDVSSPVEKPAMGFWKASGILVGGFYAFAFVLAIALIVLQLGAALLAKTYIILAGLAWLAAIVVPNDKDRKKYVAAAILIVLLGLPASYWYDSFSKTAKLTSSSGGKASYSQAARDAALAQGYAVICTTTPASYQANKEWCDHPHWVGD